MPISAFGKAPAFGRAIPKLTDLAGGLKAPAVKKMMRIMKLTAIILLAACLQVSATGYSQKITLSVKDAPAEQVFASIQKQSGYYFLYRKTLLTQAKPITIDVRDVSLQEALIICMKDQPFTYTVVNEVVVLNEKDNTVNDEKSPLKKPIDISGRVVNDKGEGVPAATISEKGSTKQTFTDNNGVFTLADVNDNATIIITHVQYEPINIQLNGKTFINITLQIKVNSLDEFQVIAYGTTTKRLNTGNVSSVKAADIENQPINNPLLALQGRVPGLLITQTSGLNGSGVVVRIQGQNSLTNGNGPLYVVDGVPYPTDIPNPPNVSFGPLGNSGESINRQGYTGRGNALSYINPSDIESIEVLKDGDATAIYGSRAANGAILITTKKGKVGKTKVDVNLQQGWAKVTRTIDLLNTRQYLDMRYEAYKNDGLTPSSDPSNIAYAPDLMLWDTTRFTDWQKTLIGGTAQYTDIHASVSGGTQAIQYLMGGTYHRESTVFPGNFSDQRGSFHINMNNISANQKFQFQVSASYTADNNQLPRTDLTEIALQLAPNAPSIYNEDGTLNWEPNAAGNSLWTNPLAAPLYKLYQTKTKSLVASAKLSYQILPGLKIGSSLGYTNILSTDVQTNALVAEKPEQRRFSSRSAYYGTSNLNTWIFEPQATYNKNIYKGKLEVLIGSTFQQNATEAGYIAGSGYNNDQVLKNHNAAATLFSYANIINNYKYAALFGRLNYNWENKYIINITGRRDGSSRFGAYSRFHNFGSIGGAWIFTEEAFMKKNVAFLSFGKLKGNYATTGSDQIGDYRYLTLYNTVTPSIPYQGTTGLSPTDIPNPYLEWEETKKLSMGIELGFLNNRILFTGNYSRNRSSNQLLDYLLPRITGRTGILKNFPATVENSNWEFSLNTTNIKSRHLNWTSIFNLTISRNKLIDFPNLALSSYNTSLIIGKPINIQRAYHFLGVDPTTGLYIVADSHGDPTIDPVYPNDATVLLTTFPKFYGGFQNSIKFKNFELDFLLQFVKQAGGSPIFSNSSAYTPGKFYSFNGTGNQPATVINRWQKPGDHAFAQKYTATDDNIDSKLGNAIGSDASYDDASYIRLKNIALSWELPTRWISKAKFQYIRIFVQGQNVLTITKYKGLDPENQSLYGLPPLRVLTTGLRVGI